MVPAGRASILPGWVEYPSFHVGLIGVAQVWGTAVLIGVSVPLGLLVAAFCGTCLVYQLDAILQASPEDAVNAQDRQRWLGRHRPRMVGVMILEAGAGFVGWRYSEVGWLPLVPLVLLSLVYVLPVLPSGRLKSSGRLKPFLIAAGWTWGAVGIPLLGQGGAVGVLALLAGVARFGTVLANAVLWDWLDRRGDALAGVRSSATEWGEVGHRRALRLSTAGAVSAAGLLVLLHPHPALAAVDAVGAALMWGATRRPMKPLQRSHGLDVDLLVAWPAVTAFGGYVLG